MPRLWDYCRAEHCWQLISEPGCSRGTRSGKHLSSHSALGSVPLTSPLMLKCLLARFRAHSNQNGALLPRQPLDQAFPGPFSHTRLLPPAGDRGRSAAGTLKMRKNPFGLAACDVCRRCSSVLLGSRGCRSRAAGSQADAEREQHRARSWARVRLRSQLAGLLINHGTAESRRWAQPSSEVLPLLSGGDAGPQKVSTSALALRVGADAVPLERVAKREKK